MSMTQTARRRYVKVTRDDISKETDISVVVVAGTAGPLAFLGDPTLRLGDDLKPVPEALAHAERLIAADLNPQQLVVVDEDGLWDGAWGDLVERHDVRQG